MAFQKGKHVQKMFQQVLGTHSACEYQYNLCLSISLRMVIACSDHHSTQNEEVYNVTYHHGVDRPCHGGVDNPNYASVETDLQYDSLRFETNSY